MRTRKPLAIREVVCCFTPLILLATDCSGAGAARSGDAGTADAVSDASIPMDTAPPCPTGYTACAGECTNTSTDRNHCGSCGNACSPGQSCVDRACTVATCNGGTTACSGACTNVETDPANCGACTQVCPGGEVCSVGTCNAKCFAGLTACGGQCVNTSNDPANCGTCGHACSTGSVCSNGACASGCGAGLTECGGVCVDTARDPSNCGGCGNACSGTVFCSAATCANSKIEHVVLIVEENHTFDNHFGSYCTAKTGSNPTCTQGPSCCEAAPAMDPSGATPIVLDDSSNEAKDRDHDQICEIAQIDNGAMDHYVTGSGVTIAVEDLPFEYECSDPNNWALAGSASVGTYWGYAASGALADRYFQPMAGSSSGNDMYFAVAHWQFDDDTLRPDAVGSGCVAPGGMVAEYSGVTTIADLLINNGVTFKMYADGYAAAVASETSFPYVCPSTAGSYPPNCEASEEIPAYSPCNFDPSDLPFEYYSQFADNPKYLVDFSEFNQDLDSNNLPSLAFVKARTYTNEHPEWSTISRGVAFVSNVIEVLQASSYASTTLILLTWDEGGGFFDHVSPPPPVATQYDMDMVMGVPVFYGTRVPMVVLGPFARAGTVSHVQMEHSSVVRFLEYNFLGPSAAGALGNRDAIVNNIGSLLDPSATGLVIPEGM